MADFLSWLLFWIGGTVGVLAMLDLLLLDRQRNWIADCAIGLFVWLDDQRELKYLRYLRRFRWQRFVMVLYAVYAVLGILVACLFIYMGGLDEPQLVGGNPVKIPQTFPYVLLGGYIGSFLAAILMIRTVLPRVLNWVTKTEGSWAYVGRSTVVAVLTIAALWAIDAVESLLRGAPPDPHTIQEYFTTLYSYSNPITAGLDGAYQVFAAMVGLIMLTSWALVVLPVILVFLLMIVFRAVEFVTVRIAESPKGPVLGLSLLLGGVGGVVKVFM